MLSLIVRRSHRFKRYRTQKLLLNDLEGGARMRILGRRIGAVEGALAFAAVRGGRVPSICALI